MITQITNRCGGIMKSTKSDGLLYINEIAPDCEFVQNIINKHTNMKWNVNNVINKFIGKDMK